jgi:hypothetical protein
MTTILATESVIFTQLLLAGAAVVGLWAFMKQQRDKTKPRYEFIETERHAHTASSPHTEASKIEKTPEQKKPPARMGRPPIHPRTALTETPSAIEEPAASLL